jgi:hypothetical protein
MTPQSHFTVVAPIIGERVDALKALLASMNGRPGMARRDNPIVPFGELEQLHYARFVILDDPTLRDFEEYGAIRTLPSCWRSWAIATGRRGPARRHGARPRRRLPGPIFPAAGFTPGTDLSPG